MAKLLILDICIVILGKYLSSQDSELCCMDTGSFYFYRNSDSFDEIADQDWSSPIRLTQTLACNMQIFATAYLAYLSLYLYEQEVRGLLISPIVLKINIRLKKEIKL